MNIIMKNVSKTYKFENLATNALVDVNLEINSGEVVVILGPSGSGKSTLLNVLSGLEKIDEGEISYQEIKINELDEKNLTKFRRDNLGFIFQSYNLLPHVNVISNVELGELLSDNPIKAKNALKQVNLSDKATMFPNQLSGGEQQRVSIARSLAKNPKVLFCDEPTGALDEESGKQVLKALLELNALNKTTIVLVTHNPNFQAIATKTIKMNSGKIQEVIRNSKKVNVGDIKWA